MAQAAPTEASLAPLVRVSFDTQIREKPMRTLLARAAAVATAPAMASYLPVSPPSRRPATGRAARHRHRRRPVALLLGHHGHRDRPQRGHHARRVRRRRPDHAGRARHRLGHAAGAGLCHHGRCLRRHGRVEQRYLHHLQRLGLVPFRHLVAGRQPDRRGASARSALASASSAARPAAASPRSPDPAGTQLSHGGRRQHRRPFA